MCLRAGWTSTSPGTNWISDRRPRLRPQATRTPIEVGKSSTYKRFRALIVVPTWISWSDQAAIRFPVNHTDLAADRNQPVPVSRARDLINTDTHPSVWMGYSPQIWLQQGDVVTLDIEAPGTQAQHVVGPRVAAIPSTW